MIGLAAGVRLRRGAGQRAAVHHEAVAADHQRRHLRILQAHEGRHRAALRRQDQGRDLPDQPARPASRGGRGRGARHHRGRRLRQRLLGQSRAALRGARRARPVRHPGARLQDDERSGDPRADGDLGRRQGHRGAGAEPLQPADAAEPQGGPHRRRPAGPENPHPGRRADPGRSAEEARRHPGVAAARRGAAGDAEQDHRRHGRRRRPLRRVQVLRHRQADDLSCRRRCSPRPWSSTAAG